MTKGQRLKREKYMKKIISLYQRNYETDRLVRDEIVPGAEWVPAGEGVATRKFDGTCCMIRDGKLYKRYDAKKGRIPPADFEPAQEPDEVTGHQPGWIPVGNGPDDKWHRTAFALGIDWSERPLKDGTYELCGPHFQDNPEGLERDELVRHGCVNLENGVLIAPAPRTYRAIKEYFVRFDIEGIVWHHPDGRMVKIKARDFGLKRIEDLEKLAVREAP